MKAEPRIVKQSLRKLISSYNQPPDTECYRTGIVSFDLILGSGLPCGRIIEFFGKDAVGKSSLGWLGVKTWQQNGGIAIVYDVEAKTPKKFIEKLGVNTKDLIYCRPQTVEQIHEDLLNKLYEIRKEDEIVPILFLWDTIAATRSEGERMYDKKLKRFVLKTEIGSRARALSKFFRDLPNELADKNATLICVNQLREKIGVMYGKKTDSPGGRALKHHASIRVEVKRRSKLLNPEGDNIGILCNLYVEKNQIAEPFREAMIKFKWQSGFDPFSGLAEILFKAGRIKQSSRKGFYELGKKKVNSKTIEKIVEENPDIIEGWF